MIRIPIKIQVHEIAEINPKEIMRDRTQLQIKVVMDAYQIAQFINQLLEDMTIEDINTYLSREGLEFKEIKEPK